MEFIFICAVLGVISLILLLLALGACIADDCGKGIIVSYSLMEAVVIIIVWNLLKLFGFF